MVGPAVSRKLPYYENLKITPYQGLAAVTLVGMSVYHNYARKRPLNASMLKHLASAAAGYFAGTEIDKLIDKRRNTKVLVLEDYIQRHPEDFPIVSTPKKYKDVLMPWVPIR